MIVEKLREVEIDIPENILTIMLLSGLGKNFENFVVAIKTREQLPSLSDLKIDIIEEGERQRASSDRTKMCVQQATGYPRKNNNSRKKRKCFRCGSKDHLIAQCKEKGKVAKLNTPRNERLFTMPAIVNKFNILNKSMWWSDHIHVLCKYFVSDPEKAKSKNITRG